MTQVILCMRLPLIAFTVTMSAWAHSKHVAVGPIDDEAADEFRNMAEVKWRPGTCSSSMSSAQATMSMRRTQRCVGQRDHRHGQAWHRLNCGAFAAVLS